MAPRLAVVGDFTNPPDEGMRKTARALASALSEIAPTHRIDLCAITEPRTWREARRFRPDALLYVPGPSLRSFVLLRALSMWCGARFRTGLTLNPEGLGPNSIARALRPDFMFFHTESTASRFRPLGIEGPLVPIGVDLERFTIPSPLERTEARKRLNLPEDRRVVLHIGHLKEGRNLRALIPIQRSHQVVIVASTATAHDENLVRDLQDAGVVLVREYLPDVQQVYHAADAYVFPTTEANNATEIPLSILEALACGVPVASTAYGAVSSLFADSPAVAIAPAEGISDAVDTVLQIATREQARLAVEPLSWQSVAAQITEEFRRRLSA